MFVVNGCWKRFVYFGVVSGQDFHDKSFLMAKKLSGRRRNNFFENLQTLKCLLQTCIKLFIPRDYLCERRTSFYLHKPLSKQNEVSADIKAQISENFALHSLCLAHSLQIVFYLITPVDSENFTKPLKCVILSSSKHCETKIDDEKSSQLPFSSLFGLKRLEIMSLFELSLITVFS